MRSSSHTILYLPSANFGNMVDGTRRMETRQEWRKKSRQWAPKSRLGCKTCKIRRIKCDLSRPSCLKCVSTGRSCDGYVGNPFALKDRIEPSPVQSREEEPENHQQFNVPNMRYQSSQTNLDLYGFLPQNLRPLMVLPATGPSQTEAMSFFEYVSIKHLDEYHPSESWRRTLMFFSQTVPAVRYAAIALSLVYRDYSDRVVSNGNHQPGDQPWDKNALLHYNRAIHLLLNQTGDSAETTAITLLVCYLFTCYDHLAGNYVQAMKHLRGGVELARTVNHGRHRIQHDARRQPSELRMLIDQVTRQIRRLDLQAVTFLVDWTPADIQQRQTSIPPPQLIPFGSASATFQSLDQAADNLQLLVARVMTQHNNTEQQLPEPSSTQSRKALLLSHLQTWSTQFETLLLIHHPGPTLLQQSHFPSSCQVNPLIPLLRLQHLTTTILASTLSPPSPDREMAYDTYLLDFRHCLTLARTVVAHHQQAGPTFTPQIGILPVLWIIGAKCRDWAVRRDVLGLLEGLNRKKEAVWDGKVVERVLAFVVRVEEGDVGGEDMSEKGVERMGMGDIPVWRRVERVSWIQSEGKVDVSYSLCGRERMFGETLML